MMIRQGDVLVTDLPRLLAENTNAEKREVQPEEGGATLAEGEATGHRHFLAGADVKLFDLGNPFVREVHIGGGGARLRHEEHGPHEVPAGRKVVIRQREYQPNALRRVED